VNYVDPWGLEEAEKNLENIRIFIDAERIAAECSSWASEGFVETLGALALHGGPWSPLDTKTNNPFESYNVPGRGEMAADEFGNYMAGYHAGYTGRRGIYRGMRAGGIGWAILSNLVNPVIEFLTGEEQTPEDWLDRDSVPAINKGYEDGLRDLKNRK
jgi:hypothetical protein